MIILHIHQICFAFFIVILMISMNNNRNKNENFYCCLRNQEIFGLNNYYENSFKIKISSFYFSYALKVQICSLNLFIIDIKHNFDIICLHFYHPSFVLVFKMFLNRHNYPFGFITNASWNSQTI